MDSEDNTIKLLDKFDVVDYEIRDTGDGSVDVNDDVDMSFERLDNIPIRFNYVWGNFSCNDNHLTSLENSPYTATKFDCCNNHLTSLEHGPEEVTHDFRCSGNKITSLEHSPNHVGGEFDFGFNPIHNFNGFKSTFLSGLYFPQTPIANICGINSINYDEFPDFKKRFEKAVDGKKVKLPHLKYLRLIYSEQVDNLEELVIENGYEIV